jgi:HK97 family phage prohead protease
MTPAASLLTPAPLLIEGYASLFGAVDLSGDTVRPGAFARSLKSGPVPMLLQHKSGAVAGSWTRLREDGRGLYVRGLVESDTAKHLVRTGRITGLSIGFRPRIWSAKAGAGRYLADVDLAEISLVALPMLAAARFSIV